MKQTWLGTSLVLVACGGPAQVAPPPAAPRPEGPVQTERVGAADPFALPSDHEPDRSPEAPKTAPDLVKWKALKTAKGLAARPAACKVAKPAKPATCADAAASLAALEAALSRPEAERDGALAGLVACKLPPGFVTALRAELLPVECSDAVTDPVLDKPPADVAPATLHLLVGQSLGAKLARTVIGQPVLAPPFSKEATKKFLATKLGPWAQAQATLVQELSALGATLSGVGQAVLAVEAGRADLRFVEVARQVPTAPEFTKDPELKQIYESALEAALEPRKARGRDATLVGLRGFGDLGIIDGSDRMQHARELLGTMYGGRRVDALDALLVPGAGASSSKLPSLVRALDPAQTPQLAAEADEGRGSVLSPEVRKAPPAESDAEHRLGRARTSLRLAAAQFRRASADSAIDLVAGMPRTEDSEIVLALGLALHQGPKDVVTMMAASTPGALGYRKLDALEAVAKKGGKYAGVALFDAALLREIAPPEGAGRKYFEDLAAQYHAAEQKLTGADAQRAGERAKHAEEIAKAAQ